MGITITDVPEADFNYPNSVYCQSDANPFPTYINNGSPGTFTAVPAGLVFVNANTGEIDLAASAPNNYQVTNTIAAGNNCPGDAYTIAVTIEAIPDAEFSYSKAAYCQNETNPTTSHITGVNGTYESIPAGIVFVNMNTGEINLAASPSGQFVIQKHCHRIWFLCR